VLACMRYVDLNPVRARMAETPEESDFTSIQQRIAQLGEDKRRQNHTSRSVPLMPLVKQSKDPHRNAIGFTPHDYLEFVDWAGRAVREGKRGVIKASVPSILQRLSLHASLSTFRERHRPSDQRCLGRCNASGGWRGSGQALSSWNRGRKRALSVCVSCLGSLMNRASILLPHGSILENQNLGPFVCCAAFSPIRCASQLRQNPRCLQQNATRCS
jgi:hypothetical protein